jgi:type II secretory pathway component PulC
MNIIKKLTQAANTKPTLNTYLILLAIIIAAINITSLIPFWKTTSSTPTKTSAIANKYSDLQNIMGLAPKATKGLPRLMLNLTLQGTITGDNGFALINTGSTVKVFRINDEIAPGAIIKQINKDYITVQYHGILQQLNIPKTKLNA